MKYSVKFLIRLCVLWATVFIALDLGIIRVPSVVASDNTSLKVGEADDALQRAFMAVSEAENAGANVSSLLVQLEEAGQILVEAKLAYNNANFNEATGAADECSVLASSVINQASTLESSALISTRVLLWQMIAFAAVGGFVFAIVLLMIWVRFRKHYVKNLNSKKPRVEFDAEA
ncbi:MAG: hypothetical protein ABSB28_01695 [Candidatus Bathyarchaeia archaeon]